jgi:hypothetical protein
VSPEEGLAGDLLLTGYSSKLRVARKEKGGLAFQASSRKVQAPDQREWEFVCRDWSGGMGLAELPTEQARRSRYYYAKNFDPTAPGILRPAPAVNALTLSIAPQAASAVRNGFEEYIGSKDYVYLLFYNSSVTGAMIAKIDNSGATPSLVELQPYNSTGYWPGQPAKVYDADESAERWYVPLGKDGDNSFAYNLRATADPTSLTSADTERSNFAHTQDGRFLHGAETATTGPLNWTIAATKQYAAVGADFNPSGGSAPTVASVETFSGFNGGNLGALATTGSNKCLVVTTVTKRGLVASLSHNGNALTRIAFANNTNNVLSEIWYQVNPDATGDLEYTLATGGGVSFTAIVLNDVDQGTPNDTNATDTGNGTTPSVAPTIAANNLGVGVVGVQDEDEWVLVNMTDEGGRHFQRVGALIWKADNFNRVSSFAIGPTNDFEDATNWGSDHPVGQSDLAITGLATLGRMLFVGKPEGLFGADENGEILDMIPEIDADPNAKFAKGFGLAAWHGRLWYPSGNQGAWRHDLAYHKDVGPDSWPENLGDEPNLSNQIRFGWHGGFRPTAKWLYNLYAPDASNLYIMIVREREPGDEAPYEVIWHPVFFVANSLTTPAEATVFISHRGYQPRLWFLTSTASVSYVNLADDGSIYEPGGDRGTSGTCQIWEPETDLNYPGTLKYLREGEAIVENGDANADWSLHYHHDGSVERSIGATFSDSGSTSRYVTAGSNDLFRRIRFSEKCVLGGALTDEKVSLRSVTYRGGYLPETGRIFHYIVDVSASMMDSEGVIDERTVEERMASLHSLKMTQVRTLTDHRGEERKVVLEDVQEVDPASHGLHPENAYAALTLLEVSYS